MARIKTIGVLTSGGDAPGMNAAIRAVTRAGICNGYNIKGIYRGYDGLINGEIEDFTTENVSGIIMSGGTILKTARSKEFMTDEGKEKAYQQMQAHGIDALVVIGGNGSLTGAMEFAKKYDVCCIGLPGTIDNDLYGTDSTIGYDTTMNTIVECVDRIRDTAQSHERIFFIEVMGRDAGFLAQNSAIASGAEAAIIPEDSTDVDQLARFMERGIRKSKKSCIVIVSEVRCHVLRRARAQRVPAVRRARVYSRPLAARRTPVGTRPHPRIAHRRWRYRSNHAGTTQRDDWRAQQRDCLRATERGYSQRQAVRPQTHPGARRTQYLTIVVKNHHGIG